MTISISEEFKPGMRENEGLWSTLLINNTCINGLNEMKIPKH